MKGFKDKDKKFHPITNSKGVRKKRNTKELSGMKMTSGIRKQRDNLRLILKNNLESFNRNHDIQLEYKQLGGSTWHLTFKGENHSLAGEPVSRGEAINTIKVLDRYLDKMSESTTRKKHDDVTLEFKSVKPTPSDIENFAKRKFAESKFDNDAERESFIEGFERGVNITDSILQEYISEVGIGSNPDDLDFGADTFDLDFKVIESKDDLKEFFRQSAFISEENDRQFSPFEIQAKELRDREIDENGEPVADAFDAFDEGIAEGIDFVMEKLVE